MSQVSDDIKIVDERLPDDLIRYATTHMVLRKATRALLGIAFHHGGYIAGGFAALLARHFVLHEDALDPSDFSDKIEAHLRSPEPIRNGSPRWHNSGCGDIDVWFSDETSLEGFMADPCRIDMVTKGIVTETVTAAGFGIEHLVPGQARVQVITRYLMPIAEQLSRFDIYNAMVAVTADRVFYPEHWPTLERQRVLHVSTWASPWTVNRVLKYLERKGYECVTPVTADAFLEEAIKALDWYHNVKPVLSEEEAVEAVNRSALLRAISRAPEKVQRRLMAVIRALPAERLLEVSALFRAPAKYDYVMKEIHKRMPVPENMRERPVVP